MEFIIMQNMVIYTKYDATGYIAIIKMNNNHK